MKKLITVFLIAISISFNTFNAYAIDENNNSTDTAIYKNEISLDITYLFQGLLESNYDVARGPTGEYIPFGLNYNKVFKNNSFGIGFSYRVSIYSPVRVIKTNDTSMIFTNISSRSKDLGLNLSYEHRNKFKKIEFFYGLSLFGYRNYYRSITSRQLFYGENYNTYGIDQLVFDTLGFDNLSSINYHIGINLNTGIRFPISNRFTFITLLKLPFYYNFGDMIKFNTITDKLEKFNYGYYFLAEVIQGKFSIAYSF